MKRIVVGYDGTQPAERALARAAQLASAFGAQVIVGTVRPLVGPGVDVPIGAFGLAPFPYPAVATGDEDDEEHAASHREHVAAYLREQGVEHDFEALVGRPSDELCQLADERGADLIVVGTHEPGFLERLLVGSVSEGIARRAHCDVLIVHPERGQK
jgi:nucleotide-binding universal stress UspA family protein